eukprot:7763369-Karenia_brevis.AAC.2
MMNRSPLGGGEPARDGTEGGPTAAQPGKPKTPGPKKGRQAAEAPPRGGGGSPPGTGVGEHIAFIKINTGSHTLQMPTS